MALPVVAGAAAGPTLLLIAGEHGNEYENIVALQETLAALDPSALKGRVVGVHCCSIDSYLNRTRVAQACTARALAGICHRPTARLRACCCCFMPTIRRTSTSNAFPITA